MKFAMLNDKRIEPQKGIKNAICPVCGEIVIPKCGNIKIHHWAHKTKQHCDPWWENETEWHRQWKNEFPNDYQEVKMKDEKTGEMHVADVKTPTDIVIEFQHSSIKEQEQYSREQFYKNMIWVVDAKKYYDKFKRNYKDLNHIDPCDKYNPYFCLKLDKNNCFPMRWLNATVPVIFDFGIHDEIEDNDYNEQKKWLWCIFPDKYLDINQQYLCGFCIKKDKFREYIINENKFYENVVKEKLEDKKQKELKESGERNKKVKILKYKKEKNGELQYKN